MGRSSGNWRDGEHILRDRLFRRYGDPVKLLSTYTLSDAVDFVLFIFEQDQDDILWDIWLHKEIKLDYAAYKKAHSLKLRKSTIMKTSAVDEQETIAWATQFIKPIEEKEVNHNGGSI